MEKDRRKLISHSDIVFGATTKIAERQEYMWDIIVFLPITVIFLACYLPMLPTLSYVVPIDYVVVAIPLVIGAAMVAVDIFLLIKLIRYFYIRGQLRGGAYFIERATLSYKSKGTKRIFSLHTHFRWLKDVSYLNFEGFGWFETMGSYAFDQYSGGDEFYLILYKKTRAILMIYRAVDYELDAPLFAGQTASEN